MQEPSYCFLAVFERTVKFIILSKMGEKVPRLPDLCHPLIWDEKNRRNSVCISNSRSKGVHKPSRCMRSRCIELQTHSSLIVYLIRPTTATKLCSAICARSQKQPVMWLASLGQHPPAWGYVSVVLAGAGVMDVFLGRRPSSLHA